MTLHNNALRNDDARGVLPDRGCGTSGHRLAVRPERRAGSFVVVEHDPKNLQTFRTGP